MSTISKPNWANAGKQVAKSIPTTTANGKERGTRHTGVIDKVEAVSYKTGSFGLKLKYQVEGLERAVYENIVLRKPNAEGDMEATRFGEATFKRRLQAFGLTSDEVNAFPIPKTVQQGEHLSAISGAPVAIYLRDREYLGKPQKDVAAVFLPNN